MPDDYGMPVNQPPGQNQPAMSPAQVLRLIAVVGTLAVLLWNAASLQHIKPYQRWGLVIVILATIGVGLTCIMLLPRETAKLIREPDLLVPLGFYVTAQTVFSLLMMVPFISAIFAPAWLLKFVALSFSVSLALIVQIVLAVLFGGWTTYLILQAAQSRQVDPVAGISAAGQWFWRVLGAELIGWGVFFAVFAVMLALGFVVLPLVILAIGIWSLIWNLATAALLPAMVQERGPFLATVRYGLRLSWAKKWNWFLPVVVQMLLLGAITVFHVSYTSSQRHGSFTTQTKSDFSVNGFWTGGYENECRWHTKLMAAVETEPLPLATFLLGLLFSVLAIIIKIRIATEYFEIGTAAALESNGYADQSWPGGT